jgi:hypothetical protein
MLCQLITELFQDKAGSCLYACLALYLTLHTLPYEELIKNEERRERESDWSSVIVSSSRGHRRSSSRLSVTPLFFDDLPFFFAFCVVTQCHNNLLSSSLLSSLL